MPNTSAKRSSRPARGRAPAKDTPRAKPVLASAKDENLLVRFDSAGKTLVKRAAAIHGLNVSDYVRSRIVKLALQDIEEANTGVLRLPREEQIAFWLALQNPPPLTEAQRKLGALVRSVM
jgi:uncharacterized protein (DUF1778 family)